MKCLASWLKTQKIYCLKEVNKFVGKLRLYAPGEQRSESGVMVYRYSLAYLPQKKRPNGNHLLSFEPSCVLTLLLKCIFIITLNGNVLTLPSIHWKTD